MSETEDVLLETRGALGRIRLNRPKAINSLSLPMIHAIESALNRFESDPAIGLVLVSGEGERGLCAGGDIRVLYENGRERMADSLAFFRDEYRMNAHIARYPKPYAAVMDGITMGGGVGISAHGRVRIVTERTKMAMPETGIGFFPDVGGTWLLSRAPGEIGTFMGLTGEAFGGADAIYAGLADFFVPSETLPALIEALAALPASATVTQASEITKKFAQTVPAPLAAQREEIDRVFASDDVEEIIAALRAAGTPFAAETLKIMDRKCPRSMKVTLRLLRLARRDTTLEQSLQREFDAVHAVLASDDFYEGVRAAVVDKDRNPKWSPATLHAVTAAMVEEFIRPAGEVIF